MSDDKGDGNRGQCLCEASEVLIFSCSGASNVGQMANEAALRLREAGKGNMYCTAGIGGHVKGLVDGARSARLLVGIDGCSVGYVRKCLRAEGLTPGLYVVVSDLGLAEGEEGLRQAEGEGSDRAARLILPRLKELVK
ncbi:MAG: putative zinc-binding protein [Thermoplasmatota archaeon]